MSDIYSSDEEFTTNSSDLPDVTVEESDGSESGDESFIKINRKAKANRILDSDSDDDDDEAERRAMSPRTRKSITGIYHSKLYSDDDSDSSEIAYSDEENDKSKDKYRKRSTSKRTITPTIENSDTDTENEQIEIKSGTVSKEATIAIDDSGNQIQSKSNNSKDLDFNGSDNEQSSSEKDISNINETKDISDKNATQNAIAVNTSETSSRNSHSQQEDIKDKDDSVKIEEIPEDVEYEPRYTSNFHANAQSLLSSTIYEETVEISSDEENVNPEQIKTVKSNYVQPKITTGDFLKMPPPATVPNPQKPTSSKTKTPRKSSAIQYVSKDFYDKKLYQLMELKQDLQRAEKVVETVGSNLPDGGRNLLVRCDQLRAKITAQKSSLDLMQIEDTSSSVPVQKKPVNIKPTTWEDLSNAVNQVQPVHTGRKGLQTFNNEKFLTVDRLKDLHGSLESRPSEDEMADTPKGLKIDLMPHQRHALKWMLWREKQKPRGGILADDMGLGKTLSLISLVLEEKNRRESADESNLDEKNESSDSENESHSDWNSKGRRTKYNGGTLVICPASLVLQWEQEVNRRIKSNRITVCVHHGQNRDTSARHLRTYDIVVSTYNIVSREHKINGALFGLKWRRIILDEAHTIRNHKAQMSMGVFGLRGVNRWALTGTPVQNKALDLYSLMKFLRCSPFDDLGHWKRWIDKSAGGEQRLTALMQTLMLRRTKSNLQERGDLNCLPEKSIELIEVSLDKDEMNVYQKVMAYSQTLFAQFLFQRAERNTMNGFIQDAQQPTYKQSMDPNGAYYKIHEKFKRLHTGQGQQVQSHEILTLLLRLRQICCHPGLIDAMLEDDDRSNISSEQDSTQPEIDLLGQLEKLTIDNNAIQNIDDSKDSSTENALVKASARVMQRSNPVFALDRCSSKINEVLKVLQNILSTSADKVIIVSQWSSVLRIIKDQIARRNIASVTLDGSVPVKDRQGLMNDFNKANSSNRVMLLSLTAGGVGLNLVGANHMIIVDLHWNPQLEAQAQDRIYRVGQKKTVNIYKLMCADTVEVRIKNLQDKKMSLAKSVIDGTTSEKGSKLTIEDLKGLFGM